MLMFYCRPLVVSDHITLCVSNFQAGNLKLDVTLDGMAINGSPFLGAIRAGPLAPLQTLFSGADLAGCIADTPCSFLVTARDSFGNVRLDELDAISALGPPGAKTSVTAVGQGVYQVGATSQKFQVLNW